MRRWAITYKRLQARVDEWNKAHNLAYREKGFLMISNDGNVHWLSQIFKDDSTATHTVGGTDGSLRSCWNRITYLSPPTTSQP